MKKIIAILLLVVLFINPNAWGQRKKSLIVMQRRPYIAFNLGISKPLSDKLAEPEDSLDYAKNGIFIASESTFIKNPFMGFIISGGSMLNGINSSSYQSNMNSQLMSRGFEGRYEVSIGPWSTGYFLFGTIFSLPFKKITLDIDLQAGLSYTIKQVGTELNLFHENGDVERIIKKNRWGFDLAASLGFGFRYTLTKKMALIAKTRFFLSDPIISSKVNHYYNGVNIKSYNEKYEQYVINWLFGVGLAYQVVR